MVLAGLLEVELTKVMNSGTTPWHASINDITQLSGKMRRMLEEASK